MTTLVDPNAPVQMVGESAMNFLYRQQQYAPPTSGPNQGMARQWLDALAAPNSQAPTGYLIK